MTTVAMLGLGAMGRPMADNLVAAGFTVRAWNRSRRRAEEVAGAAVAATPRAAAEGARFVITMVADDAALESVTLGSEGLLAGLGPDAVHLAMSTVSLAVIRRLTEAHAAIGRGFLAAPVFGRPEAARARQLWILPGGEPDLVNRAIPVFDALGQGTFPYATPAQAMLAKLAGNFLIGATVETLGEALVLAEKGGLDPEQFLGMLTATLFGAPVVRNYGTRIARTEFVPPGFTLALARKDFRLIREAAHESAVPLPVAELVAGRLQEASSRGRDGYDVAGLVTVIREDAGLTETRS